MDQVPMLGQGVHPHQPPGALDVLAGSWFCLRRSPMHVAGHAAVRQPLCCVPARCHMLQASIHWPPSSCVPVHVTLLQLVACFPHRVSLASLSACPLCTPQVALPASTGTALPAPTVPLAPPAMRAPPSAVSGPGTWCLCCHGCCVLHGGCHGAHAHARCLVRGGLTRVLHAGRCGWRTALLTWGLVLPALQSAEQTSTGTLLPRPRRVPLVPRTPRRRTLLTSTAAVSTLQHPLPASTCATSVVPWHRLVRPVRAE